MDLTPPTMFETSALLQTQQLGAGDKFGACEDAADTRPWRRLTHFRVYSPQTQTLRPIQEVSEGAELVFSGTVRPYMGEEKTMGENRRCSVKDIGPILERSFQGYGEEQLLIWVSTSRAHYAISEPADEYRPLFEPLRTEADLAACVYNRLAEKPKSSVTELGARLPDRLRPHFERLQQRVAQELLAFEFLELENGARLKMKDLGAIQAMVRAGKKSKHAARGKGSPGPKADKGSLSSDMDPRLQQLMDMGYSRKQARQAAGATRGRSIEEALDWIEAKKVEAELDEAGSDVTDTPHSEQPKSGTLTPPPVNDLGPSRCPPGMRAENSTEEDEDSSPPLRVNRKRRLTAEQGGLEAGAKVTPSSQNLLKPSASFGVKQLPEVEGGRSVIDRNRSAEPGTERDGVLLFNIGRNLAVNAREPLMSSLEAGVDTQTAGLQTPLLAGAHQPGKANPPGVMEGNQGVGPEGKWVPEEPSNLERGETGVSPDLASVPLLPTGLSAVAFSRSAEAAGANVQDEREWNRRLAKDRSPQKDASTEGGFAVGPERGGVGGRSNGRTREASMCSRQSGVRTAGSEGEGLREEEASTGAVPGLGDLRGGSSGAIETGHVEAADLLSGELPVQFPRVLNGQAAGGSGSRDGWDVAGNMTGTERNQAELDGTGRNRAERPGFGRSPLGMDASGRSWTERPRIERNLMEFDGIGRGQTQLPACGRSQTDLDGTGRNWRGLDGTQPLKPSEGLEIGRRGGLAEPLNTRNGIGTERETDSHRLSRFSSFEERNPVESLTKAPLNLTPPGLPNPSPYSKTLPRVLEQSNLLIPFSHPREELSATIVPIPERPESPFPDLAAPSDADNLLGGVGEEAFPGEVDVPLLEAERLQEKNYPGAILSLLGGEVEILIDAFAIWREADRKYYTAKAIEYDPPSHRHRVKFFLDGRKEWVALWREEVKILTEGEDYSDADDIPVCLDRNGEKDPPKQRKVSKNEAVKRRANKSDRCNALEASEEDAAASEIDDEFLPNANDVMDDIMDDVRLPAAVSGSASSDEQWRGAVKNGPRTFHFLFENVASANRGLGAVGPDGELEERENVWEYMQRHLWGIPPEPLDSVKYSVAMRKRKYVHNIPRTGRTTLSPLAPLLISEMWPRYYGNFPGWDRRKETDKLNMISTKELHPMGLRALNKKLRKGTPLDTKQRGLIRSYNLIFTSPTSVANIREEEVERIMGFPEWHTRCGVPRSEAFRALGNSFQVDTIAALLSPLVPYLRSIPGGISVLSLFDGIAGLGVALQRLGIPIRRYISVEIDPHCRTVVQNWWERNGLDRSGSLEFVNDVRLLTTPKIAELVAAGQMHLVAGGSPCNQLTGNNRQPNNTAGGRSGLLGRDSRLFVEFPRVLNEVERLQLRAGRGCVVDV